MPFTISLTYRGRAIDARLHTAVSVGLEYSIISVHKFEDLMVPRFCWLLFLLHVSWEKENPIHHANSKTQIEEKKVQKQKSLISSTNHLKKHIGGSSFYLGFQNFKPEVLCLNNLFCLTLNTQ